MSLSFWLPFAVAAQAPVPQAGADSGAEAAGRDVRSGGEYLFPSVSRTRLDMQNLAHAMQLREYCADERVPDAFVVAQLARFSRITGREENCRTLLDY